MPIRSLARIPFLLIALLTLSAAPLRAQASLSARMRAFVDEIEDYPNTELAAFFPRRGGWTWFKTVIDVRTDRVRGTGVWRFPGAQTLRAIGAGGPVCESFESVVGEAGPVETRLGMQAMMHPGRWRRVRGARFVPPGADGRSPVFVEWRREDAEWVVSAFGDVGYHSDRLLGRPADSIARDTAVVPEDAAFAPADWYTITLEGRRSTKYGDPRPLDRALLARVGVLERVSIYLARDETWNTAEVLYLPVSPGRYQAYARPLARRCD